MYPYVGLQEENIGPKANPVITAPVFFEILDCVLPRPIASDTLVQSCGSRMIIP